MWQADAPVQHVTFAAHFGTFRSHSTSTPPGAALASNPQDNSGFRHQSVGGDHMPVDT